MPASCVSATPQGPVIKRLCQPHLGRCKTSPQQAQLISDDLDISDLHLATTLTSLELDECRCLTDSIVQNLLRGVPSLQHLNVSGCDCLTDLIFLLNEELQLSREAHGKMKQNYECHLTSVDLFGCRGITSTAVRHLVTLTGPTIKSINLARCEKVDYLALLYLCGFGPLSGKDGLSDSKDNRVQLENLTEIDEIHAQAKMRQMTFAAAQTEEEVQVGCLNCVSTKKASQQLFNTTTTTTNYVAEAEDVGEFSDMNDSESPSARTIKLGSSKCSKNEFHQKQENTDNYVYEKNEAEVCLSSHLVHSDRCCLKENIETDIETGGVHYRQMYSSDLISLDIQDINFSDSDQDMVKLCLETLFKHNKNLVKLKISWAGLTNEMVSFIATQAEHLEEVSLVNCDQVTNNGIKDLGEHCKKISNLCLKEMSSLTDSAFSPCLAYTSLRHLCLVECKITDITLQKVTENLSDTLEYLQLHYCFEITESGLAAMLSRTFSCLNRLSLHQGPFTNQILVLLSERCPALTSLDLSSAWFDLEDEAMVHLAKKLTHLKTVDISNNSGLTDLSIDAFLTYCPKLKSAIFSGLKHITTGPLLKLIADNGSWVKSQQTSCIMTEQDGYFQRRFRIRFGNAEELKEIRRPHRSTLFAPSLTLLFLLFCDSINTFHLEDISAVCRGSLKIIDNGGRTL